MSLTLQDIMDENQGRIEYYHALPRWKKHGRKYREAYFSCIRIEQMLQSAINKEEEDENIDTKIK